MVFSSDVLKHNSLVMEESIIVSEDTSLFTFGLDVLRESNEAIRIILQDIYAKCDYNINESFKEKFSEKFSFKNIIKSIVKFFLDGLKNIFRNFKALINKIIYDSNTIVKYKDKISEFNDEIKYNKDFYYYSHLTSVVPSIDDFFNFFDNYDVVMDDLKDIFKSGDKNNIVEGLKKEKAELAGNLTSFYDNIRKNMFDRYSNEVGIIMESNFASILFKFFRSGASSPIVNVTLKRDDYKTTLDRFLSGKSLVKDIEKEMNYIENKSNTEIKKIEKILPEHVMKEYIPIDYELEYHLNDFLKIKCGQLQQICAIYTTVYSARLEAAKSALVQDKKILFEVINAMIKKGEI